MIKFHVDVQDVSGPWLWDSARNRYTSGTSWIEPYQHSALENFLVTQDTKTILVVREKAKGNSSTSVDTTANDELPSPVSRPSEWAGECLTVTMRPGQLSIDTGVWGTAPVYITEHSGILEGTWDLAELRRHLSANALVEREVARMLTLWRRYSFDTAFTGVYQLTERSRALFTANGLKRTYPDPAMHAQPRQLKENTDVVVAFESLLNRVLTERPYCSDEAAVELSGGMDSANVALSLAQQNPRTITTSAMLMGGPGGVQQTRRRREMRGSRFAADICVEGLDFVPFSRGDRRGGWINPYEEPFAEATNELLQRLASQGVRTVFTGLGGDEMLSLRESERPLPQAVIAQRHLAPWMTDKTRDLLSCADDDIAPASVITEVTLMSFACRLPLFLRAGLWPISPLAHPSVIRFGEWLPKAWRDNKRLFRERLAAHGFSREVVHPPIPENFALIMDTGLRRYGLDRLRLLANESILIDLGYIDGDQIRRVCRQVDNNAELDRSLYDVIGLELSLNALT